MNYYLVPKEIAEALDLTEIRKSSPGDMYLLSESDLVSYGIERAIDEGAIELRNKSRVIPAQENTDAGENGSVEDNSPQEGSVEEAPPEAEPEEENTDGQEDDHGPEGGNDDSGDSGSESEEDDETEETIEEG